MPPRRESKKPKVIEILFDQYEQGAVPDGIVTSDRLLKAIKIARARLGRANPANFLKDIVRSENANFNWPDKLKEKRISARQRYGGTRVFQFVPYGDGQVEPFPDRFLPNEGIQVHTVQSASMSFVARQLGRREETWLTQITVNLRLVESQLSIFSPLRRRVRDVTHLQMGMKTQPEIDAVFLASFGQTENLESATDLHMLIPCEAKQLGQRILEDQIREQVWVAMKETKKIGTPEISAVKPIAIKVLEWDFDGHTENVIYLVEFEHIDRRTFDTEWSPQLGEDDPERAEALFAMPLTAVSETIYRITPPIAGLNTPGTRPKRKT